MTNLLYSDSLKVDDDITLRIPTVREVISSDGLYDTIVSTFTATPRDLMVELDDLGISYSDVEEYDLFLMLFQSLKDIDTSILFGDLNIENYEMAQTESGEVVLLNQETGNYIDKFKYMYLCDTLCKINYISRNNKKAGNQAASRYLIDKERRKKKRAKRKKKSEENPLNGIIISLVNTSEFKYDYQSVLDLTIYQFNASLHQIIEKINFDKLMIGVYAGTVDTKGLSQDSLSWIKNK